MAPSPERPLDGRVALVTGVGPGIGRAVARRFAAAGATVAVAARNGGRVKAIVEELRADDHDVVGFTADLAVGDQAAGLAGQVCDACGPVQVLFNNAARLPGGAPASVFDAGDAEWAESVQVNLRAPLILAEALAPGMRTAGGGSIVNVLTTAAFSVVPSSGAPYSATKAALFHLTRMLAAELAPDIRVNAICPGTIDADQVVRPGWEELATRTPLRRIGLPAEVAEAALFLASPAASYTTAQCLFVDGGRTGA